MLITVQHALQLLTECCPFSTPHQRFTCVQLLYPHLTLLVVKPFPKRSAPYLLNTAPLGGLMPPPVRRHRCPVARLQLPPSQLQHAMNISRFIASRHTMLSGRISKSVPVRRTRNCETRIRSWRTTEPRPAICTLLAFRVLILIII